jgi:hypothetical protein
MGINIEKILQTPVEDLPKTEKDKGILLMLRANGVQISENETPAESKSYVPQSQIIPTEIFDLTTPEGVEAHSEYISKAFEKIDEEVDVVVKEEVHANIKYSQEKAGTYDGIKWI